MVSPSLSSHVSNLMYTALSAPITTGITSYCLILHSFPISLLKSWYLSIFSPSFSYTLLSHSEAISTIIALLLFFQQQQCQSSSVDNEVTLYDHIPQYLTSFILHYTIWLVIIPFLTSAQVTLTAERPVFLQTILFAEDSVVSSLSPYPKP